MTWKEGESEWNLFKPSGITLCPLADRSERGRIAYFSMHAFIHKVKWLSMRDKVPSGRREFRHMETPPAAFEVGSSLRKLGEDVTSLSTSITFQGDLMDSTLRTIFPVLWPLFR